MDFAENSCHTTALSSAVDSRNEHSDHADAGPIYVGPIAATGIAAVEFFSILSSVAVRRDGDVTLSEIAVAVTKWNLQ